MCVGPAVWPFEHETYIVHVAKFLPFRTAVPFWGQTSQILSYLSPKWDCGPRRVVYFFLPYLFEEIIPRCRCLVLEKSKRFIIRVTFIAVGFRVS